MITIGRWLIQLGMWIMMREYRAAMLETAIGVAGEDLGPGSLVRLGEDGKIYPYDTRDWN